MREPYHPACEEITLPGVLYALSDPLRLEIVALLAADGEKSCGAVELGVPKSTLSHHLRVLREAGVTQTRARGTRLFISLRREDLDARFPGLLAAVLQVPEPAC
jgi:DNA-binding transcriptional ArsR family regulator